MVFRSDIELKKKISKILTLLRTDPKNDTLHYKAGKLSLESKEYDKALSHFYTAFEQKPKEPRYLLAIGKTHLTKGRNKKALDYLLKAE